MEGKAMLFKEFGGINAFPICLNTKDTDEIVRTVKAISTGFGGINLEDISAPRCFEIEERLKEELDIPVFHDDQHGTAVVVLAALINALKIVDKQMSEIKVVVNGVGAAGVACSKIVMAAGVRNIMGCDQNGALYRGRREYELNQGVVRRTHQPEWREGKPPRRDQRRRRFPGFVRARGPGCRGCSADGAISSLSRQVIVNVYVSAEGYDKEVER